MLFAVGSILSFGWLTPALAADPPAAPAAPVDRHYVLGVDWVPTSRADLVWIAEDQLTGTLAGEFDGALRPALDMQRYVMPRQTGAATAWFGAGLSGVIPLASVRSAAYGEQEVEDAAEEARATRSRIGGVGGRVGLGAEVLLSPGITLGLRTHVNAHRGQTLNEDALRVATWIWADAALRLQIEL